ncbi:hypothetical protein [Paraburkholderia bannensis]|uniref:hypothetical protein n=1 Tax=Paraburkholderia bannensis TaxID=765414 RepID=UPI002AB635D2|nr:hypothetical protein [Paraburkholderia bannensis]
MVSKHGVAETTGAQRDDAEADTDRAFKSHLGGVYSGSPQHLVDILNPHVANWLKRRADVFKRKLGVRCRTADGKCLWDKEEPYKTVDTAHPLKNSRPDVIREVVERLMSESGSCKIDEAFEAIKAKHEELEFALLCRLCHVNQARFQDGDYEKRTLGAWSKYADSITSQNSVSS